MNYERHKNLMLKYTKYFVSSNSWVSKRVMLENDVEKQNVCEIAEAVEGSEVNKSQIPLAYFLGLIPAAPAGCAAPTPISEARP